MFPIVNLVAALINVGPKMNKRARVTTGRRKKKRLRRRANKAEDISQKDCHSS